MSTTPPPPRFTGIRLFTGNTEAWQAKRALIRSATTRLELAYFILEADGSTQPLLQDLVEAAARGVQVRLLVDYLMTYRQTAVLQSLAAHANVEVRQYGPPSRELLDALRDVGVEVEALLGGLASGDPGMVLGALPFSGLLSKARTDTLQAQGQASPASSLQLLVQVQAAFSELTAQAMQPSNLFKAGLRQFGMGTLPVLLRIPEILVELNKFLHRMHHKLLLADGCRFIMGGRNLADAYQMEQPPQGHSFRDTDLLAHGDSQSCGPHLQGFEWLWERGLDVRRAAASGLPVFAPAAELPSPAAAPVDPPPHGGATLHAAGPAEATAPVAAREGHPEQPTRGPGAGVALPDMEGHIFNGLSGHDETAITLTYIHHIDAMVQRGEGGVIDIVSAYAFLDDDGLTSATLQALRTSLIRAAQAGITVHLRTNSLASTDLQPVNKCFYQKLGALMAAGVHIHELRDGFGSLHTKAAAIGDHCLVIGSYNMDPRSEMFDTNNLIVLNDRSGEATRAFRQACVAPDCWTLLTKPAAKKLREQTRKEARMMALLEPLL
jgi:phosphatidylserine/phosphatidylglycerophosphate/cardiolipin synthase-like enzyme